MKTTSRILALLLAVLMALSVFAMVGCSETDDKDPKGTETEEQKDTEKETKNENTGSTTKFSNFTGVDWINALEHGFVGDGKTPNDKAFNEYVKYNSTRPLYFPKGVYCFEKTLNFPDSMYVKMDPEAELKCIAEEPLDYFITLRGQYAEIDDAWVDFLAYAHQSGIDGGTINCNYKAKCGIGLFQGMHCNFENFKLMNVLEKGIQTLISKTTDGCYSFENIYIYNTQALKGSYGIFDNGYDNHFRMVTVVNFNTSYYTRGGRFEQCSGWNLDMSCVDTMTFAQIAGSQSIWIGPSVDTVRYGFKLESGASTSISDLIWITNKVFYTPSLQVKYPRTIFYAEDGASARFMVNGLQLPSESCLEFSNKTLPNSYFFNVRYATDFDAKGTIKRFRDDTGDLMELLNGK